MYKLLLTAVATLLLASQGHSQTNLVLNPSFERYDTCPSRADEIYRAIYWTSIDTTLTDTSTNYLRYCAPELIARCAAVGSTASCPSNFCFYQWPRTGSNMAQVQMYNSKESTDAYANKDYLQGRLRTALVAGKRYCVSFYVNFEEISAYAIDKIGAYLDDGSIDTVSGCGRSLPMYVPQVYTTSIVSDTMRWTKIEGSFTARGGERFITIGNFFDVDHTDTMKVVPWRGVANDRYAHYLVDDVSVIPADAKAFAGRDTVIATTATDSVWVGNMDGYLPCKWYQGGTLIDSFKSGFKVLPRSNVSYIMELNVCGTITRDTLTITVRNVGLEQLGSSAFEYVSLAPNPTAGMLYIEQGQGLTATLRDMAGRALHTLLLSAAHEPLDLSGQPSGIYLIELTNPKTGERQIKQVVRE